MPPLSILTVPVDTHPSLAGTDTDPTSDQDDINRLAPPAIHSALHNIMHRASLRL
jgi:hypothetical protein